MTAAKEILEDSEQALNPEWHVLLRQHHWWQGACHRLRIGISAVQGLLTLLDRTFVLSQAGVARERRPIEGNGYRNKARRGLN